MSVINVSEFNVTILNVTEIMYGIKFCTHFDDLPSHVILRFLSVTAV